MSDRGFGGGHRLDVAPGRSVDLVYGQYSWLNDKFSWPAGTGDSNSSA
ncbi:hypothetical protein [Nonomuraea sp. NPDC049480]